MLELTLYIDDKMNEKYIFEPNSTEGDMEIKGIFAKIKEQIIQADIDDDSLEIYLEKQSE